MSFKIEGLDAFQRQLDDLAKRAEDLNGKHGVPLGELLTDSFVAKHTKFSTFDDLLKASGFPCETLEEFEAIPQDEFDKHISATSDYSSWQEMVDDAAAEYIARKLHI